MKHKVYSRPQHFPPLCTKDIILNLLAHRKHVLLITQRSTFTFLTDNTACSTNFTTVSGQMLICSRSLSKVWKLQPKWLLLAQNSMKGVTWHTTKKQYGSGIIVAQASRNPFRFEYIASSVWSQRHYNFAANRAKKRTLLLQNFSPHSSCSLHIVVIIKRFTPISTWLAHSLWNDTFGRAAPDFERFSKIKHAWNLLSTKLEKTLLSSIYCKQVINHPVLSFERIQCFNI